MKKGVYESNDSGDVVIKRSEATSNTGTHLSESMNSASDYVRVIGGHNSDRSMASLGVGYGNTSMASLGISGRDIDNMSMASL